MEFRIESDNKDFLIGSVITVPSLRISAEIAKVLYSDIVRNGECDVEFIDTDGHYRHWKQAFDGGYIDCKNLYFDCHGVDVTEVFRKYGYKLRF